MTVPIEYPVSANFSTNTYYLQGNCLINVLINKNDFNTSCSLTKLKTDCFKYTFNSIFFLMLINFYKKNDFECCTAIILQWINVINEWWHVCVINCMSENEHTFVYKILCLRSNWKIFLIICNQALRRAQLIRPQRWNPEQLGQV